MINNSYYNLNDYTKTNKGKKHLSTEGNAINSKATSIIRNMKGSGIFSINESSVKGGIYGGGAMFVMALCLKRNLLLFPLIGIALGVAGWNLLKPNLKTN